MRSQELLSNKIVKRLGTLVVIALLVFPALLQKRVVQAQAQNELSFENIADKLTPSFEIQGFSFMPGVGFIDYNNDGLLDMYFVNGLGHPKALYRNNGNGAFTDVAAQAKVADMGQGTGVAVGDLDNDGFDDIYVANGSTIGDGLDSNDGPDRLYINQKDGTFREIAGQAGISEDGFNSSVAFFDYDRDGLLDILVGRWIDFDFNPASAGRDSIPWASSHLYHNNGNLTFTEVSQRVGIDAKYNTWAIACFDYDNDGFIDVFLGYERGPIDVFHNNRNGTFTKRTAQSGDLSDYGAWMGLAVGDYDGDGLFDLFGTNISDLRITRDPELLPLVVPPPTTWDNPRPTIFHNNGDGTFTDVGRTTIDSQFQQFSWGCAFADFNNDGLVDLFFAQNLAPVGVIGTQREGAGPSKLFINNGKGIFTDMTFASGVANLGADGKFLDARGLAVADVDKDGNLDILMQNVPQFQEGFPFGKTIIPGKGKPKFFRNLGTENNWVELMLIGTPPSNRNAIGARITLTTNGGKQFRTIAGGTSAYSANSRIVHFGLGDDRKAEVEIRWPDGKTQIFRKVRAKKIWVIREGEDQRILESSLQPGTPR